MKKIKNLSLIIGVLLSSCIHKNSCEKIYKEISVEQNQIDSLFALTISKKDLEIQNNLLNDIEFKNKNNEYIIKLLKDSLYISAYQLLQENKTFKEKGLYGHIRNVGKTILIVNQKYKELDSLLQNNPCFESFEDELFKKQVYFIANKDKNYQKAKQSIIEAERMIVKKLPEELKENDIEALYLFYQFVGNRCFYQDKEEIYNTIDSLIKVHSELKKHKEDLEETHQNLKFLF